MLELLLELLHDPHVEGREMAATTLAGVVRCSQRARVESLRRRFARLVDSTALPRRGDPQFEPAMRSLHGGILGATALVGAYPYEVPPWMPALLLDTIAPHTDDPMPIASTVRRCAAEFRRTYVPGLRRPR